MVFDIGPYDPCPCGSGAKYKFCCAAKAKDNRHGKFPIGTIAYYGPDDKTTIKIAAGVVLREDAEPILERWVGTGVISDPRIAEEIRRFFAKYGVKSVAVTDGNLGCPHEEGTDFPHGKDCPLCPFWAGKQGSAAWDDDSDWPGADDDEQDGDEEQDALDDDANEENDDNISIGEVEADESDARTQVILGGRDLDFDQALDVFVAYLKANLVLPCEVKGSEDFGWEEPYVLGGWSPKEYKKLKKTQPSYNDRFQLLGIDRDGSTEWMLFSEDIAAQVRRISDGRKFTLGLAELKTTDKHAPNHQLLEDYAVWFVNNR